MKKTNSFLSVFLIGLISLFMQSCSRELKPFVLLSGSENEPLEGIIKEFASKEGYNIDFQYKGSVDIMLELKSNTAPYDGVWPASGLWITLGDVNHKVKYAQSILTSPVVFGIKKSLAEKLGFVGKQVKVSDILTAITSKQLSFMMTSASQSNSGASAYFGFLYALLKNPEYITIADLQKPELKKQIRELLSGINRSSGSSGWLKELFLKGNYDAMVNYESVIIETNQELQKQQREPLYVVYPTDGLVIADSQLGYIDNGDKEKETFFKKLQAYLLTAKVQNELLQLGRRTGFAGEVQDAPASVFRPEWGIDTKKILSPIKLPSADVIIEALDLYQTSFRKPSLTVFCLDYSGSMHDNHGSEQVKQAMSILLDQNEARKYFLQTSSDDRIIVIPFSNKVEAEWQINGNAQDSMTSLLDKIKQMAPEGGTDIYTPAITAIEDIIAQDSGRFIPAVILMTDGESNTGKAFQDLKAAWDSGGKDIPIFAITFGDASEHQLQEITDYTRGNVFDGKKDLINAFRKAKGYN